AEFLAQRCQELALMRVFVGERLGPGLLVLRHGAILRSPKTAGQRGGRLAAPSVVPPPPRPTSVVRGGAVALPLAVVVLALPVVAGRLALAAGKLDGRTAV